ncbi:unnamed protein product [Arctogadus glacialis]
MLNITETESSSSESVSDEDKEYAPQTSEESDGSSDEEPLKVPTITEELDDEEESLNEESIEASDSSVRPQRCSTPKRSSAFKPSSSSSDSRGILGNVFLRRPGTKFPKKKME